MAKLDKAPAYEAGDCRFESCSERQFSRWYLRVRLIGKGRVVQFRMVPKRVRLASTAL